jgi:hypothetical protein
MHQQGSDDPLATAQWKAAPQRLQVLPGSAAGTARECSTVFMRGA